MTSAATSVVATTPPAEALAIISVGQNSSPGSSGVTVSGTNGVLLAGDKIQLSSDGGLTWTDTVQNTGVIMELC